MNTTRAMFTSRSTVIARAGTWNRLRWPNSLIVMPAFEIPYSARLGVGGRGHHREHEAGADAGREEAREPVPDDRLVIAEV